MNPDEFAKTRSNPGAELAPKLAFRIPPILFEQDPPQALPIVPSNVAPPESTVPSIWLVATNPWTLCVQWEISEADFDTLVTGASDNSLWVRIIMTGSRSGPVRQHPIQQWSGTLFFQGAQPETLYAAEIGIVAGPENWSRWSVSESILTPPAVAADDDRVKQARMAPPEPVAAFVPEEYPPEAPVIEAIPARLPAPSPEQFEDLVDQVLVADLSLPSPPAVELTVATARELFAGRSSFEQERKVFSAAESPNGDGSGDPGAAGVSSPASVVRNEFGKNQTFDPQSIPTAAAARALEAMTWKGWPVADSSNSEALARKEREAHALPEGVVMPSSIVPFESPGSFSAPGVPPPAKAFWFQINAEVILYGATEPDAHVTIDGIPVKLRPDGSFSFRFLLPDGRYQLPVIAVARGGDDRRSAVVEFRRATELDGAVGVNPSPTELTPPPGRTG